jgi:hypothetical protein
MPVIYVAVALHRSKIWKNTEICMLRVNCNSCLNLLLSGNIVQWCCLGHLLERYFPALGNSVLCPTSDHVTCMLGTCILDLVLFICRGYHVFRKSSVCV